MYRVACNNMAQGVREVTIKRGFDPREFPLIPAGGAGPIHGCLICSELEIPLQIVPREASVLCAFGMLMCELRHDYRAHLRVAPGRLDWARLATLVETMSAEGARAARRRAHRRRARAASSCGWTAATSSSTTRCRCRCRWTPIAAARRAPRSPRPSTPSTSACTATRWRPSARRSRSSTCGCRRSAPPTGPTYRSEAVGGADASAALKGRRKRLHRRARRVRAGAGLRRPPHALRPPHRRPGPGRAADHRHRVSDGYDCVVDALGSFVLYAKGREDLVAGTAPRRGGRRMKIDPDPAVGLRAHLQVDHRRDEHLDGADDALADPVRGQGLRHRPVRRRGPHARADREPADPGLLAGAGVQAHPQATSTTTSTKAT